MRLGVAGAAILIAGCGVHAPTDRPSARSWVLLVAEGVRVADIACAEAARATKRADVAERCAKGYTVARTSLIASEAALDVASDSAWGCRLKDALGGLSVVASGIGEAGGKVPAAVADALTLSTALAGTGCDK